MSSSRFYIEGLEFSLRFKVLRVYGFRPAL